MFVCTSVFTCTVMCPGFAGAANMEQPKPPSVSVAVSYCECVCPAVDCISVLEVVIYTLKHQEESPKLHCLISAGLC